MEYNKFYELVAKWNIGLGMNDVADRTISTKLEPLLLDNIRNNRYSGFDGVVGNGWVPLLDKLCSDLVDLGWNRQILQIKEKFGTLRFYARETTVEMDNLIHKAEQDSSRICESCGEFAVLRTDRGWLKTLCNKCNKEIGKMNYD
jgi:ribosomal protein L37AE/L43A